METKREIPVQSVRKALRLLELIAIERRSAGGLSLSELAREMDMLPNSTYNIVKSMLTCGFVGQGEDGRYVPGPKCLAIMRVNIFFDEGRMEKAGRQLSRLSEKLGESVVLAALIDGRRKVVMRSEARGVISVLTDQIEDHNIFQSPTGRVLAAYSDEAELTRIIGHYGMPGKNWDGISSMAKLRPLLEGIRREGVCRMIGEPEGLSAFACPVMGGAGKNIAALGCYAPRFRCDDVKAAAIVDGILKAASQLKELLN